MLKTLNIVSIGIILLNAFRTHLLLYINQKLDTSLILVCYQHGLDLPMSFFGTRKVGEIVSRFMDTSKVREALSRKVGLMNRV